MTIEQLGKTPTQLEIPKTDAKGNEGHYLKLNLRKETPKSLDDVEIFTDYYIPMDTEIISLNKAINLFGVYSIASCSGHLDGKSTRFPWVNFAITNEEASKGINPISITFGDSKDAFVSTLHSFNSKHAIRWGIYELKFPDEHGRDQTIGIRLRTEGEAVDAGGLSVLQDSAVALANALFKEIIKKGDIQARLAARDNRYIQLMRGTLT